MVNSSAQKIIILRSSKGDKFKVAEKVAMMIQMIHHAIEDDTANNPVIPMPNVSTRILLLVLEYCTKHATKTKTIEDCSVVPAASMMCDAEELKEWDKNFIDVDLETVNGITGAAYFLSIDGLHLLACQKLASIVQGAKTVEEFRRIFNIKNDFTPEEEEQIRRQNAWAFVL